MNFYEAIKARRSCYDIGKNIRISNERIEEIIKECITYAPSAFHSQSSRALVLFENKHDEFWDIVKATLKAVVPADAYSKTATKIDGFAKGKGTILYFEDMETVARLQNDFPTYANSFPDWSHQGTGIFLFAVWSALATEGIGASIQHYNPLIDHSVHTQFKVPASWKLLGQMPFGSIEREPMPLTHNDANVRVIVQGAHND